MPEPLEQDDRVWTCPDCGIVRPLLHLEEPCCPYCARTVQLLQTHRTGMPFMAQGWQGMNLPDVHRFLYRYSDEIDLHAKVLRIMAIAPGSRFVDAKRTELAALAEGLTRWCDQARAFLGVEGGG